MTILLMGLLLAGNPSIKAAPGHYLDHVLYEGKWVQRWNDSSKVLKINLVAPKSLSGWTSEKNKLVKAAFAEWQTAMGGRFQFQYTTSPYDADIGVSWRRQSQGERVGETKTSVVMETRTLTDTDIELALLAPDGHRLTDGELKATALHEIGHALGLKGHSPYKGDIMYPQVQPGVSKLSTRDIATLKALYQRKADMTNPVGVSFGRYRTSQDYVRLGMLAVKQKNYASAKGYFTKAAQYYPSDDRLPYLIGLSAYSSEDYQTAIPHLQKALRKPKEQLVNIRFFLAGSLLHVGMSEAEAGQKTEAKAKYLRAKTLYQQVLASKQLTTEMKQAAQTNLTVVDEAVAAVSQPVAAPWNPFGWFKPWW